MCMLERACAARGFVDAIAAASKHRELRADSEDEVQQFKHSPGVASRRLRTSPC